MMKEMVFAGSGGQGVLTCGLILSDIAVANGLNATWAPSYGSAMRGGTANCTIKYGDDTIYNPAQEEPNVLLAMNDPSFVKFAPMVAPGGTIIVSDVVTVNTNIRDDINVVMVPAIALAADLNNPRAANIVMTGAIAKISGDFDKQQAIDAMNNMFAKKGKAKFAAANTAAFEAGYNAVK